MPNSWVGGNGFMPVSTNVRQRDDWPWIGVRDEGGAGGEDVRRETIRG